MKKKSTFDDPAGSSAGGGGGITAQSGYAFVSNTDLPAYYTGAIDAKKIYEMSDNAYIAGPTIQTTNMVISGTPKITIYDDEDNIVEDVSRKLNVMFGQPNCSLAACARSAIHDLIHWGPGIFNWVWQRRNGELVCTELTHLHPYTFRVAPPGSRDTRSYGRTLFGIFYDSDDRKIHYYQTQQHGSPIELPRENLFVIQDPSDQFPDGESVIYPIVPLVDFLNYAWNTAGQQLYRMGAPIMFIKIQNPQPERIINGDVQKSDVEYAREILANWGKDTQFPLRQNMEIINLDVKEGSLAITSINKANETIRDYFSPVGMLGRDGTLIAGSQVASLKLFNNHIAGWVSLLETSLRQLPEYYLKHNGYPASWRAEVVIPHNTFEDYASKIQQAQIIINSKVGTPNEVRELLGLEGVGNDELEQIQAEWSLLTAAGGGQQQQQPYYDPMMYMTEHTDPASELTPNRASRQKRRQISRDAEAVIEDSTDELLHAVLRAARTAVKNSGSNGSSKSSEGRQTQ